MASRSQKRAEESIAKLREEKLPGTAEFIQLDLADLNNIKTFPSRFQAKEDHIDMLFNNGGVMLPQSGPKTADGYELQLGTNALGHHYLTQLLIPMLEAAQMASPDRPPRVCFTSSIAHRFASPSGFNPEDPTGVNTKRPFYIPQVNREYGTSKLANILSANKFQRQYGSKGIVFTSVHPGALRTELMRDWGSPIRHILGWILLYPQSMGCLTQLYAVTAPETSSKGGSYFVPGGREVEPLPIALDPKNQDTCTWINLTKSMNGFPSKLRSTHKLARLFPSGCLPSLYIAFARTLTFTVLFNAEHTRIGGGCIVSLQIFLFFLNTFSYRC